MSGRAIRDQEGRSKNKAMTLYDQERWMAGPSMVVFGFLALKGWHGEGVSHIKGGGYTDWTTTLLGVQRGG